MKKLRNIEIEKLFLALILCLAAFLRFYRLADNPPSLNWDEVSHGYNAYSLLETGKDEWGVKWPMIFRAYGDYKLPVYIYLTTVIVKLFGLSEFAVRLPSAIFGILGVLGVYLLAREMSLPRQGKTLRVKNPKPEGLRNWRGIPLIAAFLFAVEPWGLFLSRVAVEANAAMVLIIAGAYFFFRGLKSEWWLVISSLCFGLSLFTYNSARFFAPLLTLSLVWIYRKRGARGERGLRRIQILAGVVFLVFLGAMLVNVLSPSGQARYRWVSLLDEGAIQRINQSRGESGLPGVLPMAFYNKGTYLVSRIAKNYFSHFSPSFLFFKGGTHYQFDIPNRGLLYPVNISFILIGLWCLLRSRNETVKTILTWLIIAPIASSITRDSPHALRAIIMLPAWQILAAIGVFWVFRALKNINFRLIFLVAYLSLITYHLSLFWRVYFGSYRQDYSWAWQYGYKQAVEFIRDNDERYDRIIVTKKYGEPHEFILFYWPWDPKEYRNDPNLIRYFQTDWYWVDSFGKFEFVNDWEIKERYKGTKIQRYKELLVTSPGNYPEGWEKIKTINFLDGKPAFEILEN